MRARRASSRLLALAIATALFASASLAARARAFMTPHRVPPTTQQLLGRWVAVSLREGGGPPQSIGKHHVELVFGPTTITVFAGSAKDDVNHYEVVSATARTIELRVVMKGDKPTKVTIAFTTPNAIALSVNESSNKDFLEIDLERAPP